ncbi:MAG: type I polyketide synthase, partial [Verrucomicrobiota bacterium]
GVYVGVMYEEYQLYGAQQQLEGQSVALGGSASSIANRVSYVCDFNGPSMAIDTMCSSSLTAIHYACRDLNAGEADVAIAGGVNVSIHPNKYLALSQGSFLSSRGRCESFGSGGAGFVPSEGVGAVLLKPLSQAERDGDRIYGIIKGSAVNHGGKTNGYTVPNPKAQAAVIGEAMERAGVQAGEISYLEAHGTGTSLGDPIEIAGLSRAFQSDSKEKEGQWCSIGSLKSNIGHAESAAGIGGVTKVLLQLQHQQLVPSLHSGTLNPHIDFGKTPFRVQQVLEDWETESGKPRIAGVSSFGAGGSNAHVIIEEFRKERGMKYEALKLEGPFIVPLSAKNEARLKELVRNLAKYLDDPLKSEQLRLPDLAYTLQVGREAMEARFILVVNHLEELQTQLASYQKGDRKDLLIGNIKKDPSDFVLKGNAGKSYISAAIRDKELEALAQLWVKGVAIDWNLLYEEGHTLSKISLPTYPFARERYWIPEFEEKMVLANGTVQGPLHPLVHENASDLSEQKYASVFSGKETFLSDHQIQGEKILPAVAYLDMVREAGERSLHQPITQLREITWLSPICVNGAAKSIQVSVFEEGEGLGYEVYSVNLKENEEVIHSQGQLRTNSHTPPLIADVPAIQNRLTGERSGEECYALFKELGLDYGSTFQGIKTLYYSKEEALARLNPPKEEGGYVLPPGLLDSAVQTCMGLDLVSPEKPLSLPSSVKEVNLYGDVSQSLWAYARRSEGSEEGDIVAKYDLDLLSEKGEPLLNFKHLVLQRHADEVPSTEPHSSDELVLLHPRWEASKSRQQGRKKETTSYFVFLGAPTQAFHSQVQQQQAIDSQWIGEKPPLECISEIYSLVKAYKSRETP